MAPEVESMYDEVRLSDIQLPRIYVQQGQSNFVQAGLTEPGDVVLANGSDDPEPIHLIGGDAGDAFTCYVIGRERFAATTAGGGIEFQDQRDPNDPDSWEGWFFDIALPDVDPNVPARWMLWKTAGRAAARAINTLIERKKFSGDTDPLCIKVRSSERTNKRGQKYHVPVISVGEPTDEGLAVARDLRILAAGLRSARQGENLPPEVSDQPSFS
jgi:hypothetical protein